jgi:hypothetical protein
MVWITRLAAVFWGIVEVAMPQSIPNLLWRHWIKVVYLLDGGFILGGAVTGNDAVTQFGWMALAITVAVHCAVGTLSAYIGKNGIVWRIGAGLIALALIAFLSGQVGEWYYAATRQRIDTGWFERRAIVLFDVALVAFAAVVGAALGSWVLRWSRLRLQRRQARRIADG